jgi:hypothetical protein
LEYPGKEDWLLEVQKEIYGGIDAGRGWQEVLTEFMVGEGGFQQCPWDEMVMIKWIGNYSIEVCIHTDDGAFIYDEEVEEDMENFIKLIKDNFDIRDLGEIKNFVGIRVESEGRKTSLDQSAYIKSILDKYQENRKEIRSTTGNQGLEKEFDKEVEISDNERVPGIDYWVKPSEEDLLYMKDRDYRGCLGMLQYAVHTRPDIAFRVGKFGRFADRPRRIHWESMQHLLAYLRGTLDYCLTFDGSDGKGIIEGWTDGDFAQDLATRRSTSGGAVLFCGGAVVGYSKRQKTVADSTKASEQIALHVCLKEILWVRNIVGWLLKKEQTGILLNCDNAAVVTYMRTGGGRNRSKYLDIKYLFGREYVKNGTVDINWVSTAKQYADLMTKILTGPVTRSHCKSLGLLKGRIKEKENVLSEDRVMFCVQAKVEEVYNVKVKPSLESS